MTIWVAKTKRLQLHKMFCFVVQMRQYVPLPIMVIVFNENTLRVINRIVSPFHLYSFSVK